MDFEVRRSLACRQDLEALFDHLVATYTDLGESLGDALDRAAARIEAVENSIDALARTPHQGTLWPEVMDGLRWTTKDRAILYFVTDAEAYRVDVLAVFFGGQNHKDHILRRLANLA